jgi:NADPH:quinone reductase-like Zn-dependent oxidoreductase
VRGRAEGRASPPFQLLDAGGLEVPIQQTYELDRAGKALQALAGHTQGKLALRVA